jgi:uncharacterized protein
MPVGNRRHCYGLRRSSARDPRRPALRKGVRPSRHSPCVLDGRGTWPAAVEEAFFFSKEDPQLKVDHAIDTIFPESLQLVIAVEGDLRSPAYEERVRQLSDALASEPGVRSVQSLSRGPKNLDDALKSPLWSRLLISADHKSSYTFVTLDRAPHETVVRGIEALQAGFDRPDFHVTMSGVPYVNDQIRRNLARDMRVFSLAAVGVFGLVLFVIFRSPWILVGTFVACADSSAMTLLATHWIHIPIGPLTANLSTMVFVMTLSPIVFLTFNWKGVREEGVTEGGAARRAAVARTVTPSFWSSVCIILGFVSLLLVPSTPMRHLGIAGAIGAALAFGSAYVVYPWFLEQAARARAARAAAPGTVARLSRFFGRPHGRLVAALAVLTMIGAYGLRYLNTDPTLPSYFKTGGDLRTGLEVVDRAGGSSPLKIVVEDQQLAALNTGDAYTRLWTLQHALERDPAVGTVVSLPVVLGEAKRRWFGFLVLDERWITVLASPKHGEISRGLITANRTETLFLLRMRETGRTTTRQVVIDRLKHIVEQAGFSPVLVGGTYGLLDQQAQLVRSSLISGVFLLIGIFVTMGYAFSRSFTVAGRDDLSHAGRPRSQGRRSLGGVVARVLAAVEADRNLARRDQLRVWHLPSVEFPTDPAVRHVRDLGVRRCGRHGPRRVPLAGERALPFFPAGVQAEAAIGVLDPERDPQAGGIEFAILASEATIFSTLPTLCAGSSRRRVRTISRRRSERHEEPEPQPIRHRRAMRAHRRRRRFHRWRMRQLDQPHTPEPLDLPGRADSDESRVREPAQSAHGHDQERRVLAQPGDGDRRPVGQLVELRYDRAHGDRPRCLRYGEHCPDECG